MASAKFYEFFHAVSLHLKVQQAYDEWIYTQEPHASRRKEILKKYPQMKRLFGYNPMISIYVFIKIIVQLTICYMVRDVGWTNIIILAYCVGGVLNHSLGSAIHEIGHNLAFGHTRPLANRLLSIFCNLPLGIPFAISYKKYHSDHHRWLGHDTKDVDIPTVLETKLFRHPITRMIWLLVHPVIHGIRPFFKNPKPILGFEIINIAVQLPFDYAIYSVLGPKSLAYLVIGTLLSLGAHPLAGHFISEHYLFNGEKTATLSYYGPLNFVLYNVGYHVEHHDFPYIPFNKLPEVRRIAPEFYDTLPYHSSLLKVLWEFIFATNGGPQARGVTMINKDKGSEE